MTEAQTWTVIVGLLTVVLALFGFMSTMLTRTMKAEFGSVRAEFGSVRAEFGSVRAEFDAVRTEVGAVRTEMRAEFRRIDDRLDHLDRDVQALTRRMFDSE